MHLYDLIDESELRLMLDEGFVRETPYRTPDRRGHVLPLVILNYAEKAVYGRTWNPTTLACRGLIYETVSGQVLARPWGKFFNYGETDADLPLDVPCEVTNKADGSLGILYGTGRIATRGSFHSEQAEHATALYRQRYQENGVDTWRRDLDLTYLFEIVYPANRIVLDYGDLDDLVLLGAVHIDSGRTYGPEALPEWPGPRTAVMPATTLREALALPDRPNAEGVVVRYPHDDLLVKIKQEDYKALHAIITNLNERAVWARLGAGETAESIAALIPDEFHDWLRQVVDRLTGERDRILAEARAELGAVLAATAPDRRAFAERAAHSPHRALLFLLLDGKDPLPSIWKGLRPTADNYARPTVLEDAA